MGSKEGADKRQGNLSNRPPVKLGNCGEENLEPVFRSPQPSYLNL